MITDPVADYLTRIRNALAARHKTVDIPASKQKEAITAILVEQQFLNNYKRLEKGNQNVLRIYLKYDDDGNPAIAGMRCVSTPGLRRYVGKNRIPRVMNQLGISILTTPKGIVTGGRAHQLGVGGEVICYIW